MQASLGTLESDGAIRPSPDTSRTFYSTKVPVQCREPQGPFAFPYLHVSIPFPRSVRTSDTIMAWGTEY
jgi:hypothetical protein